MTTKKPKGRLVESGALRVDRSKALKKLQKYQLPGSVSRLGLWLKVAVFSGALELRLGGEARSNVYRFGGRPLPLRALRRPYEVLFEPEGDESARLRHFSLALMNSYYEHLTSIEVISGVGKQRYRLVTRQFGQEDVTPCEADEEDTIVRLKWSPLVPAPGELPPLIERVLTADPPIDVLDMSPIPVKVSGTFGVFRKLVPAEQRKGSGIRFSCIDRTRVFLKRTWNISLTGSQFRIGKDGVDVQALSDIKSPRSVFGWIDDPQLTLDASMARVVKNKRYEHVREILEREIVRFQNE